MRKNKFTSIQAVASLRALSKPILSLALFGMISAPLSAQVVYEGGQPWGQRAGSGPDAEVPGWFYNLGITGIRAELVKDQPKALVVRHVFKGTPGSSKVKVGDVIIGAGGKKFRKPHLNGYGMEVFGAQGPVSEMADALEECQGKSGRGELTLTIQRDDKTMDVVLKIGKKYGDYSATFPEKCPKSEKILKELLDYMLDNQSENGSFGDPVHNTFAALALMGSGEKRHLRHVERNLRYLCKTIDDSVEDRKYGLMNWTYMGTAICLSEYYLITKKKWVLPELNKINTLIKASQYMDMSQINPKVKETHPDAYPQNAKASHGGWGHNPGFEGYGPISMLTGQGALAYALMHRCGIEVDRERLDAAYAFLKRGTAKNGYLWYGDQQGGGDDAWADMGRTGASGIANFLNPFPNSSTKKQARLHAKVIGDHPESFPDTHGSPVMGMAYAALAANTNPKDFRKLMDSNRWWFTMAQCDDKTFYYQPNRDNAGYGDDARMTASCVVAFIYTIQNHNLIITGKENSSSSSR